MTCAECDSITLAPFTTRVVSLGLSLLLRSAVIILHMKALNARDARVNNTRSAQCVMASANSKQSGALVSPDRTGIDMLAVGPAAQCFVFAARIYQTTKFRPA